MSKVYLVGAGPGDPELITVKGRRVLEAADVVLYDNLANPALLQFAPASAELLYVGKKRAQHAVSQDEICSLLIDRARAGLNVVRLKGGDPFIFGRGGEEVEQLAEAGIAYEVVPGVTAPLGIAAYTGVPLTHRDHTSVVTFVTGHSMAAVNWSSVAGSETLVVFMGLHHLAEIVERLIAAGRPADTPAMAVEWGTLARQRTVAGTLETLVERVESSELHPPATVIIGGVVTLHEKLSWFERLPLHGVRVIVTRPREQAHELTAALHAHGAEVIELPVIEMAPPSDTSALEGCIVQLESYDWIVFTSTNAVEYFLARVDDLRRIKARICAIGESTAAALARFKLGVDLLPENSTAEGVAQAFERFQLYQARVLFPRSGSAREVVPAALAAKGALVDSPTAYRNIVPPDAESKMKSLIDSKRGAHWITFSSPSTVKNFLAVGGHEILSEIRIATIGPTTTNAAHMHGLKVAAEARVPSVAGLIEAILSAHQI